MREHRLGVDNGFTLIELLIVIVILGILAGIVVFSVSGISGKADTASCKTNVATIQAAAEAYALDNGGAYPASVGALVGSYLRAAPDSGTYSIAGDGTVTGSGC
ncbi:MAG: competence type IV pilus major pilin ComGC [Actinomycetota bacterium]